MRGDDQETGSMFSYRSLEDRIPREHPLRPMRAMVDEALEDVSPLFTKLYANTGRPSIPPERLLRALLLQILFSVRSERQLMEELEYNLLFRWFVGLGMDDAVWVPTTFTKNRDRLLEGDVARAFFDAVLAQAESKQLLSSEHFSVDGTLIEAWASHKSFQPKSKGRPNSRKKRRDRDRRGGGPRNPTVNFRGERRVNETHQSTTDPEARLMRSKGKASKLPFARCDAPRGTEHDEPGEPHRRPDDAAPGIPPESTNTETSRRGLRLDEDGGSDAQDPASR